MGALRAKPDELLQRTLHSVQLPLLWRLIEQHKREGGAKLVAVLLQNGQQAQSEVDCAHFLGRDVACDEHVRERLCGGGAHSDVPVRLNGLFLLEGVRAVQALVRAAAHNKREEHTTGHMRQSTRTGIGGGQRIHHSE